MRLSRDKHRCSWAGADPLYRAYHDSEWGVAVHDDRKLFEFLVLEGFQAGLSWLTILRKRDNFRRAFDDWDWTKIARYGSARITRLLANPGIVRNRLKIKAAIGNARATMRVCEQFGSFDRYIWKFTDYKTVFPAKPYLTGADVPARTPLSDAMSGDLKKRGFSFVGPTICYAFMQAVGMADDHMAGCFKCQPHRSARKTRRLRR